MRILLFCLSALLLAACAATDQTADGDVRLMPRPDNETTRFGDDVPRGASDSVQYMILREPAALAEMRARFGLEDLFADINFADEIMVGAVGNKAPLRRTFRIFRAVETAEHLEVHLMSYPRGRQEADTAPWVFVRFPATDKPVRFFLNDRFAYGEHEAPLAAGRRQLRLTRESLFEVYVPENLRRPAPLVVLLHGSTISGERFIRRFVKKAEEAGVVLLAPTARNGYYWTESGDFGPLFDAIGMLRQSVEIDPDNIFLGGGSAGGHTSYSLALENRTVFKGFFALAGRLNPNVRDEVVARARDMPVCIIAGGRDDMVPLPAVQAGRERLEQAGARVTFHVLEDAGHALMRDSRTLEFLFQWLTEQIEARADE